MLQGFLTLLQTTVFGGIAIYIAWRQWKTANAKLVMDLFEKRFALYKNAYAAIAPITRSGRATDEDLRKFDEFMDQALFLFGADVEAYLKGLRENIIQLLCFHCFMIGDLGEESDPERGKERLIHVQEKAEAFKQVMAFYDVLPKLCSPYMKLDQKVSGSFFSFNSNIKKTAKYLRQRNLLRESASVTQAPN
jgi:hypothetical protein